MERFTSRRMRRLIQRSAEIYNLDPERRPVTRQRWPWRWLRPSAPPGPAPDAKTLGRQRYESANRDDRLGIDELFDLYEEISAVYLRGLLDDAIFVDQIAPQLVVDWRIGHWLINDIRRLPNGSVDVGVYENWQRVYMRMIRRNVPRDEVPDSDEDAGDYALLPDLPRAPLLWPDRVRWTGFRNPPSVPS
jgi:hypothetical protein